jgi:L-threonylcarbamoyladenylate synthase
VSAKTTLEALAVGVPDWARALVEEFWPGPLTLVFRQQPSLQWDLGETRGTVAVRMPDHDVALELLSRTGPLAVSSANRTGLPAAIDADAAEEMLGETVRVILDAGPTPGPSPSTILDCTAERGRVLRQGVLPLEQVNEVVRPLGAEIVDEG